MREADRWRRRVGGLADSGTLRREAAGLAQLPAFLNVAGCNLETQFFLPAASPPGIKTGYFAGKSA